MTDWTPPLIIVRDLVNDLVNDLGHDPDHDLRFSESDALGIKRCDAFDRLSLPTTVPASEHPWVLARRAQIEGMPPVLELIRPDGVTLCLDFSSGKARHRASEAGKGIQPLARALGLSTFRKREGVMPRIIDATGGLGQDAWALATLGATITVIERHPVVHALLDNALMRAAAEPASCETAARISLLQGRAEQLLPDLEADVIYLDPMYPERRRKKAGSRKGMQFLHALLGPPDEGGNDSLLSTALKSRAGRVAVKRPKGAELLAGSEQWQGQRTCIESPNTRYDVYHLSHT